MITGCIIQARMTSTRLPRKVLRVIDFEEQKSVLEQVVERVKCVQQIDKIIIATTVNPDDDEVVEVAEKLGVGVHRGSEKDVLERFAEAAEKFSLDTVIRITSDCPFLDPDVISALIDLFYEGGYDYASNCIRRTFPHGLDCEILKYDLLEWMHKNASDSFSREHVTSFITSHLDDYRIGSLEDDEDNSQIRITVDTVNDYVLACVLNDLLREEKDPMSRKAVLDCYKKHPYLPLINGDIMQKKQFGSFEEELSEAVKLLKLQEMNRAADALSNLS